MVTPSISTENRLCWLKSPAVFLVLPLRTSRLNFTGIQLLLSLPRAGAVHCDPAAVDSAPGLPLHTFRAPPGSPSPTAFRSRPGSGNRARPRDATPPLLRLSCHLADAEDDEFRRLHRSDADLADHLARVDDLRRVGLGVALHVERLFRRLAHQRARVVDAQEERGDVARHPLPQRLVVRLEHHPLGPDLDRLLDHQEEAADVDVAPRRIAGDGARSPYAAPAVAHVPDAVDPARVEEVLLRARDGVLEAEGAADDLVRGSLVHAALGVAARVDAGHVARWRNEDVPLLGVVHLDPGEVVRRVLRVARLGH